MCHQNLRCTQKFVIYKEHNCCYVCKMYHNYSQNCSFWYPCFFSELIRSAIFILIVIFDFCERMARHKSSFFSRERQALILYLIAKIREVDHPQPFGCYAPLMHHPRRARQSGKPMIFFLLLFPIRYLSPIVFPPRFCVGIAPFVAFGVHRHRRELEARRTSSPTTTCFLLFLRPVSSFSLLSPLLFSTSVLLLLYIGEPPLNSLGH